MLLSLRSTLFLLVTLVSIPHYTQTKLDLPSTPPPSLPLFTDSAPYFTKKSAAYTLAAVFLACSIRLFAKKKPKGEQPHYPLTDLLKVWNVLTPSYWAAFDAQIIGTKANKPTEVTITTFNWKTHAIEKRIEKVSSKEKATGLFGYCIYKCILLPLKGMGAILKPFGDIAGLAKLFPF
jgi:hypothetical protein